MDAAGHELRPARAAQLPDARHLARHPADAVGATGHGDATVTYTERNFLYEKLRLRITRAGRTELDVPDPAARLPRLARRPPVGRKVRDLDGGEPEVLVDMYTGGAHCCPSR